jgi:CubicO group peptidase (beta-lactamase class C family)
MTDQAVLQTQVSKLAAELDVPGVAVGVVSGDEDHVVCHGVTSIEDPLAIDSDTLFQIGSTGKTYTGTAIMRLVEQGVVDLDASVRTYVPELQLKDEQVARDVTVLQLLNHTAGWDGDLFDDMGEGDDALERYVVRMATIEQVTPLGATVSYNNASLGLAGLLIQRVTGKTYEQAVVELVLEPLGLQRSMFPPKQIMTYRFSQGHRRLPDGTIELTRPWDMGRFAAPMGGLASSVADQLVWARFHMGDGAAPDGTRVLTRETIARMQQPTAECPGNALGDAIGIDWLLRDVEGLRVVAHGGDTMGQHSIFEMVPERSFAITSLTNCGPNGGEFNEQISRWAFEAYLGVVIIDPEPLHLDADALAAYTGRYETIASTITVRADDGALVVEAKTRPELLEQFGETESDDEPPIPVGILEGEGDRYIVPDGSAKGMRGYFTREGDGAVNGMHIGGRYAKKTG